MVLLGWILSFGLVGCGGEGSGLEQEKEEDKVSTQKVTQEGPFSNGTYGDVNVSANYALPQNATLIDIRNEWEREVYGGYPEGSLIATYQVRQEHTKNTSEDKSKRRLNEHFVSDVLNLVGQDKNSQIILVCVTGSRTGAKEDREKSSAAKYLSSEGLQTFGIFIVVFGETMAGVTIIFNG